MAKDQVEALEILAKIAAHSQRVNDDMIDKLTILIKEIQKLRRDLIRAPISVFGLSVAVSLFWFERLDTVALGAAVIIFLSPFYPESIKFIMEQFRNNKTSRSAGQ